MDLHRSFFILLRNCRRFSNSLLILKLHIPRSFTTLWLCVVVPGVPLKIFTVSQHQYVRCVFSLGRKVVFRRLECIMHYD